MERAPVTLTYLERPVYGFPQVDDLLGLKGGTARRWIDGYERRGKGYPPIVRETRTDNELVTWGEFVETGLLASIPPAASAIPWSGPLRPTCSPNSCAPANPLSGWHSSTT